MLKLPRTKHPFHPHRHDPQPTYPHIQDWGYDNGRTCLPHQRRQLLKNE